MDFVSWLVFAAFIAIIWFNAARWDAGIKHRRKARQEGRETSSLWWHVNEAARERGERRKSDNASQPAQTRAPSADGAKPDARGRLPKTERNRKKKQDERAAVDSLNERLKANRQSAREAMRSDAWKYQARKRRAAERALPDSFAISPGTTDRRLRFVYEDFEGNTSTREVSSWRDDGTYIEGFCHSRNAVRTFRRDRIVSFLAGEDLLGSPKAQPRRARRSSRSMEILFTGFAADRRADLEQDAESHGMTVRKTVSQNLTFVCAGPRAGRAKLADARAQGCTVLDEDQFHDLLATGVLPD